MTFDAREKREGTEKESPWTAGSIASGDRPRGVGACVAVKFAERAGRPCRMGAGGEVGGHGLPVRGPAGNQPGKRAR
jgi:hypothetical protein